MRVSLGVHHGDHDRLSASQSKVDGIGESVGQRPANIAIDDRMRLRRLADPLQRLFYCQQELCAQAVLLSIVPFTRSAQISFCLRTNDHNASGDGWLSRALTSSHD